LLLPCFFNSCVLRLARRCPFFRLSHRDFYCIALAKWRSVPRSHPTVLFVAGIAIAFFLRGINCPVRPLAFRKIRPLLPSLFFKISIPCSTFYIIHQLFADCKRFARKRRRPHGGIFAEAECSTVKANIAFLLCSRNVPFILFTEY